MIQGKVPPEITNQIADYLPTKDKNSLRKVNKYNHDAVPPETTRLELWVFGAILPVFTDPTEENYIKTVGYKHVLELPAAETTKELKQNNTVNEHVIKNMVRLKVDLMVNLLLSNSKDTVISANLGHGYPEIYVICQVCTPNTVMTPHPAVGENIETITIESGKIFHKYTQGRHVVLEAGFDDDANPIVSTIDNQYWDQDGPPRPHCLDRFPCVRIIGAYARDAFDYNVHGSHFVDPEGKSESFVQCKAALMTKWGLD